MNNLELKVEEKVDEKEIEKVVDDNKEAQKIYSELNKVSGDARFDHNGIIYKK